MSSDTGLSLSMSDNEIKRVIRWNALTQTETLWYRSDGPQGISRNDQGRDANGISEGPPKHECELSSFVKNLVDKYSFS